MSELPQQPASQPEAHAVPGAQPGGSASQSTSAGQPEGVTSTTPYDEFGGEQFFVDLVADFYRGVAGDPLLRPMYPESDLGPAEERLRLFLMQYWGGPRTYSEQRGHPRLRMRHAPYPVDDAAKEAWLHHMRDALDARHLDRELDLEIWAYLTNAAEAMVNTWSDGRPGWQ